MNLMVTTNQNPIIDTHTKKSMESKHNTKKVIKSQGKRAREEDRNKELQKKIRKQ